MNSGACVTTFHRGARFRDQQEITVNPSQMNKCVLEPEMVPGVSSEARSLAMLIVMPLQGVVPCIDITIASKTYRSLSRILDVSVAFVVPTEGRPASIASPLSLSILGWFCLGTARFVRGRFRLLILQGRCLGG